MEKMDNSEKITPEVFEHLVKLASLHLDQTEADYLRRELNHQLQAIQELEAIPIPDGLKVTVHGIPYPANTPKDLREDLAQPFMHSGDILKQAPQLENDQFAVPEIPHTTLE
jgi:aspartyl-tRNA(Asn)/glutamyl-tRNA(Gln) amidotransferase subunit C